ncbi:MAG: ATP-binding cassette domain-containing protein, partial [candidate division Zixibacteria bacterium]|nr:ATP-binding cassette domain-containing protein [candidate division Zixibacteria bacterium]
MTVLTAENLCKKFRDQVVLEQVSFSLRSGERIALVGKNGIGKTTLLEIITGKQSVDSGAVTRAKECRIDYIEQEKSEYLNMTVFDFVADARADLVRMRREIAQIEHYLEENPTSSQELVRLGDGRVLAEVELHYERTGVAPGRVGNDEGGGEGVARVD